MRGSHTYSNQAGIYTGIIPAHAGLTETVENSAKCHWDHPRACGAHRSLMPYGVLSWGSSPRMRGSQVADAVWRVVVGIIPAHAGLTRAQRPLLLIKRDHPRACGAHVAFPSRPHVYTGSSPRMRGSLSQIHQKSCSAGIIPAHAGLTFVR